MNIPLQKPLSLAEFLAWEEKQPLRYEFDGYQPIAMTGGTAAHADLQANLAVALRTRLRGSPCRFYGSDLKIEVAGHIRYPDGFIVCSPVPPNTTVVRDPIVIFEILSPSTSTIDRIVKNAEYRGTPSVCRYVMLEQDRIGATVFSRTPDDWVGHILLDDAILELPEVGLNLPLAELYEGITLTSAETPGDQDPV